MPRHVDYGRFASRIRNILLAAGEEGIQQRQLYHRVRTKNLLLDDMISILTNWKGRRWVNSYRVVPTGSNRYATIWRATTLLRDEFFDADLYKD